jgi:hypothetical protein
MKKLTLKCPDCGYTDENAYLKGGTKVVISQHDCNGKLKGDPTLKHEIENPILFQAEQQTKLLQSIGDNVRFFAIVLIIQLGAAGVYFITNL